MAITLELVDEVRSRTGVSYKEAKEALEFTNGDVLDAIVYLEKEEERLMKEEFSDKGNEIIDKLKGLVDKGVITKILVKKDEAVIMNVPILAGIVGAMVFSPAIIAGIVAALATGCDLYVVKEDGDVINIKEYTEDKVNEVKEKVSEYQSKDEVPEEDDAEIVVDVYEEDPEVEAEEVVVEVVEEAVEENKENL